MAKGRKTSFDERVEIVKTCIESGHNYRQVAQAYKVSYQQIRKWTIKYEHSGVDSLQDGRGKRKDVSCMSETEKLQMIIKLREAENARLRMENDLLKKWADLERRERLNRVRLEAQYQAIKGLHEQKRYPISILCEILQLNRSAYYKWLHRRKSITEMQNEALIPLLHAAYGERNGILGYRQMTIKLNREQGQQVNHKRIYRLMRLLGLKSVCRRKRHTHRQPTPERLAETKQNRDVTTGKPREKCFTDVTASKCEVAENLLNRNFTAEKPCEKWLTDVTELEYGDGKKAYLSAIFDLGDRSVVSYVIGHSNDNALVFDTFDQAVSMYPTAKPIFHSDRGFQYTHPMFKAKLEKAGMTQSMSRVSRCLDNGPMEGFWGILKSEMYYLRKFDTYMELVNAIHDYIDYYHHKRYQKRLRCMSPFEYRVYLNNMTS